MSWLEHYHKNLKSADEAVKVIESGDRVVLGHACGEPRILPEAMVKRAKDLNDVEVVHMVAIGQAAYCRPGMEKHFRHNSLFAGGATRRAIGEGRADYTPCFFSEIPSLFGKSLPVDVALVQVSPPDKHGFCSLGISVDYTRSIVEYARTVIAEVNPHMPRTYGDSFVRVEDIDCFVPSEEPLYELPRPQIGPVEEAIGRSVAGLVEDGSCLQLGIGAIPDAVLGFLKDRRDLGIHSEMFSDGVLDLVEAGVVTGQKKKLHRGKLVATFLMGTTRLYQWVHENPQVRMYTVDYINDPYVIAQNDNAMSINSALQVDLMGQVCADTLGPLQYSGVGGQVDFIRGAARSRGGKSIIALPSTAMGGKVSRIVCGLDPGSAVTTSRNDVHYVVTEYGAAELRGKTVRQRIKSMIDISHPSFRESLTAEARLNYKI